MCASKIGTLFIPLSYVTGKEGYWKSTLQIGDPAWREAPRTEVGMPRSSRIAERSWDPKLFVYFRQGVETREKVWKTHDASRRAISTDSLVAFMP
jgi:hypothetical protein